MSDINRIMLKICIDLLGIEIEILDSREFNIRGGKTGKLINICKDLEADAGTIPRADIQTPAKKTFIQSATTALKNVGDTAMKIAAMSPTLQLVGALGTTRNESPSTIAFNKNRFNIVTSPGAMQGRIVGDDGSYDPANNLFHGMNRTSAFGNLEKAGQKRIDRINKTLEKQKKNVL